MVDFSKLVGRQPLAEAADPLKLFESLDRKGSHTTLRPAQIAALKDLRDRRAEHDLVLKMPTGMGKSTVGLLHLTSHMIEDKQPSVYLCPTTQLVKQVLEEANRVGIAAHDYPAGERYPHAECLSGRAVLVCTYAKLFNGRTTFDRTDVGITPCALVLDDAHAGIEEVRNSFTLRCSSAGVAPVLLGLLDGACRAYAPGAWEAIRLGRPDETLEIPFWLWAPLVASVREALTAQADHPELRFVWPHLRDHLRWCRCVVAADGVEIIPIVIPVQRVRAFSAAAHRLFMSGTLADESILVREIDCDAEAGKNPVVAGADVGLGERMVLAPSLVDSSLDREWVMRLCQTAAKRVRVVALCASESKAQDWASAGATVVTGDAVTGVVEQLRTGSIPFAALAQRYDGIDLPDDACRLLVLDGMPFGQGIVDRHDSAHARSIGGARNRLIFRIEQGMGRAVRSPADYAVVILAGPELASFTAKTEVRDLMSADARAQLELAYELAALGRTEGSESPSAALVDMINKCLRRDASWKQFYDERVRKTVSAPTRRATLESILLAQAERVAANKAADGDTRGACLVISDAVARYVQDELTKGGLLQQKANYCYDTNTGEALEIQKAAYSKNRALLRPPEGVISRPFDSRQVGSPARILKWYGQFAHQNGAIADFQVLRVTLSFASTPSAFEQALKELAPFLGAEGLRPERDFGAGPDNLLLWPEMGFVIEAKNGATSERIPKKDAEQLLHSIEWFKNAYQTRSPTPIMASKTIQVADQVFLPEGARILTPDGLAKLIDAVDSFLIALVARTAGAWSEREIGLLLTQHGIAPEQIAGRYTVAAR